MKKVLTLFILFFIIGVALEGSGKTASQGPSVQKSILLGQKVNPASAPTITPMAPISPPGMSTLIGPSYDPTGKPDPFLPTRVSIESRNKGKKVLPLEQFEVNDFELVGLITGSGANKAMVQDLTGKGYILQVGTSIGKMGGKVTRISEKEVFITEPFQDFLGRKRTRVITLKLPEAR
jgi:Tfp pilus assembly protein PilP